MSGNTKSPVWVNGTRYDDIRSAAKRICLLLGWEVSIRWVSGIVKEGLSKEVNGVTVSTRPPETGEITSDEPVKPEERKRGGPKQAEADRKKPASRELSGMKLKWLEEEPIQAVEPDGEQPEGGGKPPAPSRLPLIRYPRGESPLERGPNHVYR